MMPVTRPATLLKADHWIGGKAVSSPQTANVISPYFGQAIGKVSMGGPAEVAEAVAAAKGAARAWAIVPLKERCAFLFRFREQLMARLDEISQVIALESGKTPAEGKAGLLKGIEVLEFAL